MEISLAITNCMEVSPVIYSLTHFLRETSETVTRLEEDCVPWTTLLLLLQYFFGYAKVMLKQVNR